METQELKRVDGATLKKLRRVEKITQKQMAAYLGVSERQYQRIENGEDEDPGIRTMSRIAKKVGVLFEQVVVEDPELPGPPEPPGS